MGINHLHFLRKAEIVREVKKLYKNLTKAKDFRDKKEISSLPELFEKVKKRKPSL